MSSNIRQRILTSRINKLTPVPTLSKRIISSLPDGMQIKSEKPSGVGIEDSLLLKKPRLNRWQRSKRVKQLESSTFGDLEVPQSEFIHSKSQVLNETRTFQKQSGSIETSLHTKSTGILPEAFVGSTSDVIIKNSAHQIEKASIVLESKAPSHLTSQTFDSLPISANTKKALSQVLQYRSFYLYILSYYT